MTNRPSQAREPSLVVPAVAFEIALGGVAVLLGWLFQINPFSTLSGRDGSQFVGYLVQGLAAVVPLLLLLIWARRSQLEVFRQIRQILEHQLLPHFAEATPLGLWCVALAAGIGEELLFRGFLQPALERHLDPSAFGGWLPLVLTSLVFGMAHYVSGTYLVLATGMGLYLGLLLIATGSLWPPLVAHAVYDFVALWMLQRDFRKKKERPDHV